MGFDGGGAQATSGGGGGRVTGTVNSEGSSSALPQLDEDTMWQMITRGNETMESGPFPERPGKQDCSFYMRTGACKFGMTCRFNHPANRNLAVAVAARINGVYPERIGQAECQYYLKTGTCKFGSTCKFHHPRDKAGIAGRAQLNLSGYPLRPNEQECAYYIRTGQCKFGSTCKFHHPQLSSTMVSLHGSPVYRTAHSPTSPGQQSYPGRLTNWSMSRPSYVPSPRWQGTSSYAQLILPQGLVHVPGWNAYAGQLGSISSPESQQQSQGSAQFYGSSRQGESNTVAGAQGGFSSYRVGSIPVGVYPMQRENVFPERPGEPECQFYMKTGDCKFGAVCKFHHPRERTIPAPNCVLSPLGLPLRQGEPLCGFYSRYGICKFGPNCKFDHPMPMYGGYSPSSADLPGARRLTGVGSVSILSEVPIEATGGNSRRIPLPESRSVAPGDESNGAEGSHGATNAPASSFS